MLNSNRDRAYKRTSTLILAVLFSVAGLGQLAAQTQSPLAGSFDELFANQDMVTPLFARPEVSSRLPALPTVPDESAPGLAATASTNPPGSSEPQGQSDRAEKKGIASALKKLDISPAEAGTSPAPPPSEAPQPSEPHDMTAAQASPSQPTVTRRLPAARLITSRRSGRPAAHLRTIGSTRLSHAGQPEARATVQASRPMGFSRFGHLGSGRALWYQHPGRTASGETFNPNGLTAAHRALPFGMRVRVLNKKNGRSVTVRINDRINDRKPVKPNYVIVLSRGSARALRIEGVGSVVLYRLS